MPDARFTACPYGAPDVCSKRVAGAILNKQGHTSRRSQKSARSTLCGRRDIQAKDGYTQIADRGLNGAVYSLTRRSKLYLYMKC